MTDDPRFKDIGTLPSYFVPYEFKSLFIKPLQVGDLRDISKAAMAQDYQLFIRAIGKCVSRPIEQITLGDFYFILMWLKIHSTTQVPYTINWECNSQVAIPEATGKRVYYGVVPEGDYRMVDCDTLNTELVHNTQDDILCLDENQKLPEPYTDPISGVVIEFDYPRVDILAEMRTLLAEGGTELTLVAAQWVKGGTLAERAELLDKCTNLDAYNIAINLNNTVVHGIRQTTVLTCRNCRRKYNYKFSFEPLSFFP